MVQQTQAVLLDLQEFLVGIEDFGGPRTGFQDKPLLGVPQHFFEVALLRHGVNNTGQLWKRAS
jgi:hypothetical protein